MERNFRIGIFLPGGHIHPDELAGTYLTWRNHKPNDTTKSFASSKPNSGSNGDGYIDGGRLEQNRGNTKVLLPWRLIPQASYNQPSVGE